MSNIESLPEELRHAIAVLTHELRNPLSVLRAGVDLLSADDQQQKRLKEVLLQQTLRMTRLVDDLSDLSRAQFGKLRIERQPLRLQDVILEAAECCRPALAKRCQHLELQLSDDLIWIDGDRDRIGQLLSNLLSNASKYSEPELQIELSVTADAQEATIRVRDAGIGIAENDLNRVFEFLSQCENLDALDHRQGGLGIGLALSKQIVEQHDGLITAHSNGVGQGSEFIVRLPILHVGSLPPQTDLPHRSLPPLRVLVVDDNPSSQFLMPKLIRRLGLHEVQVSGSGEQAIAVLEEFVPDLILLDLGLPDMSGIQLARLVRRTEKLAETCIVALTGYEDEELRRAASEAGFNDYRIKPVSMEMLRDIFEQFAARWTIADESIAVSD